MEIDLHAHTTYSDGTFSPEESVARAREVGLTILSISDHDTTGGLPRAFAAADGTGLEIVPGVEFSALYDGGGVHVLAYWMDLDHEEFQAELRRLRDDRLARGEQMVRKLQALGHPIVLRRVRELAKGGNIGRPHVAHALVEAGVVATIKQAFTTDLIGTGGKGHVEKHAIHPVEAVRLIKRAGGVAVMAHPALWRDGVPAPDELIEEMVEAGLDGLEADHPSHDPATRARYRAMAHRFGLAATGSSDCHGTRYDPVRMGSVRTHPDEYRKLQRRR